MTTDRIALGLIHLALGSTTLYFLVADIRAASRARRGEASTVLTRGDTSMNLLLALYTVTTVAMTLAVQVADGFVGNKVMFVAIDYAALTYLHFSNYAFRNWLLQKWEQAKKETR